MIRHLRRPSHNDGKLHPVPSNQARGQAVQEAKRTEATERKAQSACMICGSPPQSYHCFHIEDIETATHTAGIGGESLLLCPESQ